MNFEWLLATRLLPAACAQLREAGDRQWCANLALELEDWRKAIADAHAVFLNEIRLLANIGLGKTRDLVLIKGADYLSRYPHLRPVMYTRDIDLLVGSQQTYKNLRPLLSSQGYAQFECVSSDGRATLASDELVQHLERDRIEYQPWVRFVRIDPRTLLKTLTRLRVDLASPFRPIQGHLAVQVELDIHHHLGCSVETGSLRVEPDNQSGWRLAEADHIVYVGVRCEPELASGDGTAVGTLANTAALARHDSTLLDRCDREAARLNIAHAWRRFALMVRALLGEIEPPGSFAEMSISAYGQTHSLLEYLFEL